MSDLVPIFLYGTLRPGQRLHSMIEHDIELIEPATAPGRLYHHVFRQQAGFPVARFDRTGTIYGDYALVNFSTRVRDIISMEIQAGYDIRDVTVDINEGEDYASALGFHFLYEVGERIQSGDWTQTPEGSTANR